MESAKPVDQAAADASPVTAKLDKYRHVSPPKIGADAEGMMVYVILRSAVDNYELTWKHVNEKGVDVKQLGVVVADKKSKAKAAPKPKGKAGKKEENL